MENRYRKIQWTEHSKLKMRQYGLSKIKLITILRKPERQEAGIVEGTSAAMRTNKTFFKEKKITPQQAWKPKKAAGEIWIMYRDIKDMRRVISAWRYPGVSKPGEEIPIPKEIRDEIMEHGEE